MLSICEVVRLICSCNAPNPNAYSVMFLKEVLSTLDGNEAKFPYSPMLHYAFDINACSP